MTKLRMERRGLGREGVVYRCQKCGEVSDRVALRFTKEKGMIYQCVCGEEYTQIEFDALQKVGNEVGTGGQEVRSGIDRSFNRDENRDEFQNKSRESLGGGE
jgi:hypothetical protein